VLRHHRAPEIRRLQVQIDKLVDRAAVQKPKAALSNRMTSRSHANPFVTRESQSSRGRGEVVQQQQREVSTPAEAPIGEPDASDLNEFGGSRFMRSIGLEDIPQSGFYSPACGKIDGLSSGSPG